jgi:hypothetical protein
MHLAFNVHVYLAVHMYGNRTMKSVEIVLRRWEGREDEGE